jgi:D-alanyl-D-alanine carboxypeptidase/D-alanyl-D-alanine-endopeptidase (penicillin-binding protein 4)
MMLRMSVLLSAMLIAMAGCSALRPTGIPSDPVDRLRYDIDAVLKDSAFRSVVPSLKVVALSSGEVLYDANSELYIRPASNMKLLTSAAALHILGPAYRFRTTVSYDSLAADSSVGHLYLRGYGNPDLGSDDIDSMARGMAERGLRRVTGDIVADETFFDSLSWGAGWMWDDEPAPYQAYISALGVNRNCVMVTVAVDSTTMQTVVTTEPHTAYVRVVNSSRVVTDTVRERLTISRPASYPPNTIVVAGEMLSTSEPREEELTVLNPSLYAGTLFAEALRRHGVAVDGQVRPGGVPPGVIERFTHVEGIDSAVVHLNKVSDNLSTEMLLKSLGATLFAPPGSAAGGRYAVNGFLAAHGIDSARHRMADGSGLSHYSLLRVGLLVDLLVAMYHRSDLFPLYFASLPIAGVDGTLSSRMKATSAEGNVRAKTGTISGVSSLSGYVRTRDGEFLAFGMTMQDFIAPSSRYRLIQDRICELLADFSRGRVLAQVD